MERYPTPDEQCVAAGSKFLFLIDRQSPRHSRGDIVDGDDRTLWRYSRRHDQTRITLGNPFWKPDFVVSDPDGQDVCVIRRTSFVPSRFQIMADNQVVGDIALSSMLRNRYRIGVHEQSSWTFRLTLFTVYFWGDSLGDPQVWVQVGPSKMEWSVLIKSGVEVTPLIFALAFIHNEWWNYS